MVTEDPQLTGFDVHIRRVGNRWDLVGITEVRPPDAVFVGKLRQHPGQGGITGLELGEERGERIRLRGCHRRQGIEGREDEPLLGVGQLDVQDRDRRLPPADRELDPKMAIHDVSGRPVDEDLAYPAHLGKGTGEGRLLLLRMGPPVGWVGEELLGGLLAAADDAVLPSGGHAS